jgi:16S rRNA (cytidine1402-2'-O)-methyltransferase
MNIGVVYIIPSLLAEEGIESIPAVIVESVKQCSVFFVEDERTARRYLKKICKEIVIDEKEWFAIGKAEENLVGVFIQKIKEGKTVGIISEAGCPGIADPGQYLVAAAQRLDAKVIPLVGPSSIILALMASGMNGQSFRFLGYLPIDAQQRMKALKDLETESKNKNCTQIFIETPYRNNQMVEAVLRSCSASTRLCLAVDLTGAEQWIRTMSVGEWKQKKPDIHKRPAIFLVYAG